MGIHTSAVPLDRVGALLKREEGHFVDMKAREIAPGKLTRSLSAFANADGGEIYVGIAQNPDKT